MFNLFVISFFNYFNMINLIVLSTDNLAKSLEFYSFLGFIFQEEKHGNGPIHYSCEINNLVLELYLSTANFPAEKSTRIGITLENFNHIKNQIIKKNIPFKNTENFITIEDPDGRKIYLSQK